MFGDYIDSMKFPSFIDLPLKIDTPVMFYVLFGTTTLALTYVTFLDSVPVKKTAAQSQSAFSMLPSISSAAPTQEGSAEKPVSTLGGGKHTKTIHSHKTSTKNKTIRKMVLGK